MILASVPHVSAAELPKAPVPKSPYIAVVYRYADTMLEKGRDSDGPQKTGLFLSALDRTTLAPLTHRPAAPTGVRESSRVGAKEGPLVGANPQHDENLLRLLYLLSELSAKPKYRDAANASLRWLLTNAPFAGNDGLPWGPVPRGVAGDRPPLIVDLKEASPFSRPWLLWERCFEAAPEASQRMTPSLLKPWPLDPRDEGFQRQLGFQLRTWAAVYAQTKDERFVGAIGKMLIELEEDQRAQRSSNEGWTASPPSRLSLAIDCDGAAHQMFGPLASRLRAVAAREDETFCALQRNLRKTGGFISSRGQHGGAGDAITPRWNAGAGRHTTAQIAMMCVSRYDNTGKTAFRDRILAAADAYLDSLPTDNEDVWPATFGHAISLQVAAWRHSAKPVYLERARTFADLAIERFFGTNALPRASFKSEHYESITGADTLALALAELHLQVLHITAVRCPPNTIDR